MGIPITRAIWMWPARLSTVMSASFPRLPLAPSSSPRPAAAAVLDCSVPPRQLFRPPPRETKTARRPFKSADELARGWSAARIRTGDRGQPDLTTPICGSAGRPVRMVGVMEPAARRKVMEVYERSLQRHGPTVRALHWGGESNQQTRFRVLSEVGP